MTVGTSEAVSTEGPDAIVGAVQSALAEAAPHLSSMTLSDSFRSAGLSSLSLMTFLISLEQKLDFSWPKDIPDGVFESGASVVEYLRRIGAGP